MQIADKVINAAELIDTIPHKGYFLQDEHVRFLALRHIQAYCEKNNKNTQQLFAKCDYYEDVEGERVFFLDAPVSILKMMSGKTAVLEYLYDMWFDVYQNNKNVEGQEDAKLSLPDKIKLVFFVNDKQSDSTKNIATLQSGRHGGHWFTYLIPQEGLDQEVFDEIASRYEKLQPQYEAIQKVIREACIKTYNELLPQTKADKPLPKEQIAKLAIAKITESLQAYKKTLPPDENLGELTKIFVDTLDEQLEKLQNLYQQYNHYKGRQYILEYIACTMDADTYTAPGQVQDILDGAANTLLKEIIQGELLSKLYTKKVKATCYNSTGSSYSILNKALIDNVEAIEEVVSGKPQGQGGWECGYHSPRNGVYAALRNEVPAYNADDKDDPNNSKNLPWRGIAWIQEAKGLNPMTLESYRNRGSSLWSFGSPSGNTNTNTTPAEVEKLLSLENILGLFAATMLGSFYVDFAIFVYAHLVHHIPIIITGLQMAGIPFASGLTPIQLFGIAFLSSTGILWGVMATAIFGVLLSSWWISKLSDTMTGLRKMLASRDFQIDSSSDVTSHGVNPLVDDLNTSHPPPPPTPRTPGSSDGAPDNSPTVNNLKT